MNVLAKILASKPVADWIICKSRETPYFHLVDEKTGSTYMERYWFFNSYEQTARDKPKVSWLPSIRIHHIKRPDLDRNMHDHPWDARTVILRGWYVEEREAKCPGCGREVDTFIRNRGDTAKIGFGEFHNITHVSPGGVWTMFIMSKYRGVWGFKVNGVKVPWRKYLGIE